MVFAIDQFEFDRYPIGFGPIFTGTRQESGLEVAADMGL